MESGSVRRCRYCCKIAWKIVSEGWILTKKPKKKAKPKDFTACDLQSVFILVADIAELAKKKKPTDAQKAKLRILVDAYKRLPLPVRRAVHAASSRS